MKDRSTLAGSWRTGQAVRRGEASKNDVPFSVLWNFVGSSRAWFGVPSFPPWEDLCCPTAVEGRAQGWCGLGVWGSTESFPAIFGEERTVHVDMKRDHVDASDVEEGDGGEGRNVKRKEMVEDKLGTSGTARDLGELKAYGLEPGNRIEVLWDVVEEREDGREDACEQPQSEWWSATLGDPAPLRDQERDRRVWQLHYDERKGFPTATCQVVFHSSNVMYDLEYDSFMKWRREGDIDAGEDEAEQVVMSLQDCLEAVQEDTGTNDAQGTDEMDVLRNLPITQQHKIATGFRHFADTLKAKLKDLMETKGEGYVVQASDIRDVLNDAKS